MQSITTLSQSIFPVRVWVKTSETPMCSNPNCCSNMSWVEQSKATEMDNKHSTAKCTHEQHNKHCCRAEANKTCTPTDWRVLYKQSEPDWEDIVRRKWMTRWLRGQCTLFEAVQGYEVEWGSGEARERRAAA